MKKLLACLIVVTLLVACVFSASAAGITADEKKIIDALSEEIKMASGKIVALPGKYINQAEDYLTKADLTDQQITAILGHIWHYIHDCKITSKSPTFLLCALASCRSVYSLN